MMNENKVKNKTMKKSPEGTLKGKANIDGTSPQVSNRFKKSSAASR
jgi:hypothetical protein